MLAVVVLVGAGLRFSTLGHQSYWFDESATVDIVSGDLGHALAAIPETESTPPLYYLVAWSWANLFGTGEAALRSLSALFGTATIIVAFAVGRHVAGGRGGIVTAALIAVNPLLIWYSQEARAYALLVLLAGISLLFFLRTVAAPTRKNLAAWTAASCLTIATHYFGVFIVAAQALWLSGLGRGRVVSAAPGLREPQERLPGKAFLAALLPVAATGGGLVPLLVHQSPNAAAPSGRDLWDRIVRVPIQFVVGLNVSVVQIVCLIAICSLLTYGAFELVRRGERPATRFVLPSAIVGALTLAAPVALAFVGLDYLNTRNVLPALLPLAVVMAAGLARLPKPRAEILSSVLCLLFLAVTINVVRDPTLQRTDFRGAAEALGKPTGNRAIVATLGGDEALGLYLPRLRVLPDSGADVREIDLIGLGSHNGSNRGVVRPPAKVRPPAGFHEVQRDEEETYSLVRFRSSHARRLSAGALFELALPGAESVVLLQSTR